MVSTRSIAAAFVTMALLAGATVVGGIALNKRLGAKYDIDRETEEQKVLLVGTWKKVDDYEPKILVGLVPVEGKAEYKTLTPDMMKYNDSGQQDVESCWIDLSSWFASEMGDQRIDKWCSSGGRITFQSSVAGVTSASREMDSGGGSYFVEAPEGEGEDLTVIYDTVTLQIAGLDVA